MSDATRYPLAACACGCGQTLTVLDDRGRSRRFISGHNGRGARRRVYQTAPTNYPREGQARIHRQRAERALQKPLPPGAQVHHLDGDKREDGRLVICQDDAFHKLLHARARVLAAGGDPNTEIICKTCARLTPAVGALGGHADRCPPCNRHNVARARQKRLYGT